MQQEAVKMGTRVADVNLHPPQAEQEATRFSCRSILRSEQMYGEGFQSPGGLDAVEGFCRYLRMQEGMAILDIGSGIGGASLFFAQRYGATVMGIDSSKEMVEISTARKDRKKLHTVSFHQGDIRTLHLPTEAFDLTWTRDCILYIEEKALVWKNIYASLKRGGQLFITDFCKGEGPLSESFECYVKVCGYHLQDIGQYGKSLEAAGFQLIRTEDITKTFVDYLRADQKRLENNRDTFLQEYEQHDFDYLMNRWDSKIRFCEQGDMKWGLFIAQK